MDALRRKQGRATAGRCVGRAPRAGRSRCPSTWTSSGRTCRAPWRAGTPERQFGEAWEKAHA
eukprot:3750624-Pleurochrysis_carterae.AAC.2